MNAKDFLIKYTFQDEEEAKDEQNERFARMMESYHQHKLRQANVSCGFTVGTKIPTKNNSYIKILAIVDGYVMARYKGCIPFCKSIKGMQLMIEENRS